MTSDYPMGAECDVAAIVAWRMRELDAALDVAVTAVLDIVTEVSGLPLASDTRRMADEILAPLR